MPRFLPPDEPVELYITGFDNDLLGREKVSKNLSDVLERIEDPLVVALDGRWGTGKSYFLKRWVGAHRLQNEGTALTVYFDAFANDYLSDPLISLVSALSARIPKTGKRKLDRLKKVAVKFAKPLVRIGLAAGTQGAAEILGATGDAIAKATESETKKAVDEFWKRESGRQAAMTEFSKAIEALAAPTEKTKALPLIIVIDELDRCRPDYALEVLEVIKHFFAVPHVHFVLGVNLKALENSVKARYGVEIDATSYLQKFLSFTLNLPDNIGDHSRTLSVVKYANHLGTFMGTPKHILTEIIIQLQVLSRYNQISIRDVGKIISTAALLPDDALGEGVYTGFRSATITLIITKIIRSDLFPKLLHSSITYAELVSYIGVTETFIKERLPNDTLNPDYNHNVDYLYTIWNFICNNETLKMTDEFSQARGYFGRSRAPHDMKGQPLWIFENWMNIYKLA